MTEQGYRPDHTECQPQRFVVISGCSGGGKSTLLAVLAARGHSVFEEPGRQIVKEQLAAGGDGLPWGDAAKFIALCVSRSLDNLTQAARRPGVSFFDRGLVDAISNWTHLNSPMPEAFRNALEQHRYHRRVFMTPPWPEIYVTDNERRHSFEDGVAEYEMLRVAYARLGYEVVVLPKVEPEARATFVLERVSAL